MKIHTKSLKQSLSETLKDSKPTATKEEEIRGGRRRGTAKGGEKTTNLYVHKVNSYKLAIVDSKSKKMPVLIHSSQDLGENDIIPEMLR